MVSPEPDVEVFELNPRIHRCILFGSDGLWNMISTQAAVRIVQKTDEENEKIILEGGRANETVSIIILYFIVSFPMAKIHKIIIYYYPNFFFKIDCFV